ncbi:NAD-dependent epimerase/dehydratase family protein [Paenibacillus flagellatus]|uniref:Uncharacterized protein n=1 Tax=Paenibacillus flagellatus TaxID=2211139 RepID=A0A2V5K5H4_9BACL|nr:NmrA family NAD(P)-binding protein [Paenibacillus flagellatus]PYI52933.1 hypothetical protein DLM86_18170 [Paenibacillus flagellatus]
MLYVTGITGHTGMFFLNRLKQEGFSGKIRCLVREKTDTHMLENTGLNLEIVRGSIEDKQVLESSMVGAETVLHISTILLSNQVVEAAIKNRVKWAILVHTTGRFSKYKSASEEYIKIEESIIGMRNQIGITILRPTMIYGTSRDRNMYKLVDFLARHRFFPMFGEGENLMQPIHAKDLGNAYYDVLINKHITYNKEYNLAGKAPIRYIDLIKCVSKNLGKNTIIVKFPLWFSILAAKIYNKITKKAIISVEQVLRMQEDKSFSYEEAYKDFNFRPLSFEEGIISEVKEYVESRRNSRRGLKS